MLRVRRIGHTLRRQHAMQPFNVQRRVGDALILQHPRVAERKHRVHGLRERCDNSGWKCRRNRINRSVGNQQRGHHRRLLLRRAHDVKPFRKTTQTRRAGNRIVANDCFKVFTPERKQSAARHRAKHHRADNRSRLACDAAHVENMMFATVRPDRPHQRFAVDATVAQLHPLHRGQRARR